MPTWAKTNYHTKELIDITDHQGIVLFVWAFDYVTGEYNILWSKFNNSVTDVVEVKYNSGTSRCLF